MRFPIAPFVALSLALAGPAFADSFTPDQTKEIQKIIKAYLVEHPEVIAEAADALQKQDEARATESRTAAIKKAQGDLLHGPDDIVMGNPKGNITLVEFFDYRCGYCKRALPEIADLLKSDPQLRLVMKQFPILGPDSVVAARAVLAAKVQGADKQLALHKALEDANNPIDETKVFALAGQAGLNVDRLKEAMKDPRIDASIAKNKAIASEIKIDGTPTFIVGQQLMPGVESAENLKKAIAAARKAS